MDAAHILNPTIGLEGRSTKTRKIIDPARRFASNIALQPVRDMVWRDFLRGASERGISVVYRITRPCIEEILRDKARAMAAACRTAGIAVSLALAALVGVEAWEWSWGAGDELVARVPRTTRGRRRGRREAEDGAAAVEMEFSPAASARAAWEAPGWRAA